MDLLSTMVQTNLLNTYIDPKPLWQDTHEFLQGLDRVTLVKETHTCMHVQDTSLLSYPTMHPI